MKILIATPIYDTQVLATYHLSILDLVAHFARRRPEVTFIHRLLDSATVGRARNALASLVLEDPSYTHLLFIDADMGFRPTLIEKLLAFSKPIASAICPQRRTDYDRLVTVARQTTADAESVRLLAQGFVGEGQDIIREPNGGIRVRNGFVRLKRGGTGIMLIRRDVLETMRDRWPELVAAPDEGYRRMGLKSAVLQVFTESVTNEAGIYVSEDYAFTGRWVDGCGGEIWACADETVTHMGREQFSGNYQRKLAGA